MHESLVANHVLYSARITSGLCGEKSYLGTALPYLYSEQEMGYFLGAWIGMNLLTFLVWGRDKQKAISGGWRMSEKTLLLLSICGGWLGAILAIDYFRHKTIKSRFVWKLYAIGLLWIVGIMVVMMIRF